MAVKIDPKAREAVSYLPQDGSFITYDEWKKRLRDADRFDLVRATRIAKLQGLANYVASEYEPGVVTLEVQLANPAAPMARADTLRPMQPPAPLIPKGGA
jgi:hypothetical protein